MATRASRLFVDEGRAPRASRRLGSLALPVAVLALLFALTFTFPQPGRAAEVAPALWPRALLLLTLVALAADRLNGAASSAAGDREGVDGRTGSVAGRRPLVLCGIFALYAPAMHFVGFIPATLVFVACAARPLGVRGVLPVAALTAASTAAVCVLFLGVLYLPLPRGDLTVFYETNSRVYDLLTVFRR